MEIYINSCRRKFSSFSYDVVELFLIDQKTSLLLSSKFYISLKILKRNIKLVAFLLLFKGMNNNKNFIPLLNNMETF